MEKHATLIAILLAGCGGAELSSDPTVVAAAALGEAADVAHGPELGGMLRPPGGELRQVTSLATRCDLEPELTYGEVCGAQELATADFAWTGCATAFGGPGGLGGGCGPGDGTPDGGQRLPPPDAGTSAPQATSDGELHVVAAITSPPETCEAEALLNVTTTSTFAITRRRSETEQIQLAGTFVETADRTVGGQTQVKLTTVDTTRNATTADGTVTGVHLTGELEIRFDAATTPATRVFQGALSAEYQDGTTGQLVLTQVVRPPPSECEWPTSGTVQRTGPDEVTHTLVFGPTCGVATLDGEPITLQSGDGRRDGGPHRRH